MLKKAIHFLKVAGLTKHYWQIFQAKIEAKIAAKICCENCCKNSGKNWFKIFSKMKIEVNFFKILVLQIFQNNYTHVFGWKKVGNYQSNSKESTDFWTLLACTTQYTTNWGWGFSNIKISWFIQSNERVNLNKYFPGQIYFFFPLNKSW